ncbi:flagellar FliL protein [Oxalobacteraceae bacterium GrIS 2.11]
MAKTAPKEEAPAGAEQPVATGSKKKKIILIAIIAVVVLAIGGGTAAFFLTKKPANTKEVKKSAEKAAPPVFLALENFIVNLQTEGGDKYLQTGITLQVRNEEQLNYYKANMPQLRSRILLLLANKGADELLTNDGKLKLEEDLIKQVQMPYNNDEPTPKEAEERKILGVYFTSFMIQ